MLSFQNNGQAFTDSYVIDTTKVTDPNVKELLAQALAKTKESDYTGPIPDRTSTVIFDRKYVLTPFMEKNYTEVEVPLPCQIDRFVSIQEPLPLSNNRILN